MKILFFIFGVILFQINSYACMVQDYPKKLPQFSWIIVILGLIFFLKKYKKSKNICMTSILSTILTMLLIIIPCFIERNYVEEKYKSRLSDIKAKSKDINNFKIIEGRIVNGLEYDSYTKCLYSSGMVRNTISIKTINDEVIGMDLIEGFSNSMAFLNDEVYIAYLVYENSNILAFISQREEFNDVNEFKDSIISKNKDKDVPVKIDKDGSIIINNSIDFESSYNLISYSLIRNFNNIFLSIYIILLWFIELILFIKDKINNEKRFKFKTFLFLTIFKILILCCVLVMSFMY